ncbi:hypothetical protein HH214_21550 (plasmid) [Mucilaginibacter robiniae]|uniref:Uncharacterized protein n=1 Tax=Mucilaginibacter robiniae TaxID=2728022 RepID=A0A7L5E678_9SPHI|nr:hypothetical protein [Mucilaginibacter robiniae]QJD98545.1 hypothetical protein HH214_21550 [Mucilaginibacter robiniae]
MSIRNKTEHSLQHKLQLVADGASVELTKAEAELYGVDVADVLPDEDLEDEGKEATHGN